MIGAPRLVAEFSTIIRPMENASAVCGEAICPCPAGDDVQQKFTRCWGMLVLLRFGRWKVTLP